MKNCHAVRWNGESKFKCLVPGVAAGLAFALQLAPIQVLAHSYKLDTIAVGHVWAPPPEEGAKGIAVYGPILNRGDTSARLVGASSPIAEEVRFRISKDGDVNWPEVIELRPNKPVSLASWREHIWLSGVQKPVEDGDSFELILDFGDAGKLPVKVVVEDEGAH
jgi:copper(I)-binding protein